MAAARSVSGQSGQDVGAGLARCKLSGLDARDALGAVYLTIGRQPQEPGDAMLIEKIYRSPGCGTDGAFVRLHSAPILQSKSGRWFGQQCLWKRKRFDCSAQFWLIWATSKDSASKPETDGRQALQNKHR